MFRKPQFKKIKSASGKGISKSLMEALGTMSGTGERSKKRRDQHMNIVYTHTEGCCYE